MTALHSLATASTAPMYWVGAQTGISYELTKTSDGRVFIRYLPTGVAAGSDQPYLTIGTYPVANAYSVVTSLAKKSDAVKVALSSGIAFYSKSSPTNVYVAFPNVNYEIEVYDPTASEAQSLVVGGKVTAIVAGKTGATRATGSVTTTAKLKKLETKVKHTIYWAGSSTGGGTLELSQTSGGSVYLRYLPKGVAAGANHAYTTIGSYPVTNAYVATKKLAKQSGSVQIKVAGAVAFYSASRPTNVYLAYKGTNVQIEVYDPLASHAHDLVSSRSIVPVP